MCGSTGHIEVLWISSRTLPGRFHVDIITWVFQRTHKLAPVQRGQRRKEERGRQRRKEERGRHARLVGRVNKQDNLHTWFSLSDEWSLHPPARILTVYIEALTEFSPVNGPDGPHSITVSKAASLKMAVSVVLCGEPTFQIQGRGEEPAIAQVQLPVMPFQWSPLKSRKLKYYIRRLSAHGHTVRMCFKKRNACGEKGENDGFQPGHSPLEGKLQGGSGIFAFVQRSMPGPRTDIARKGS